MRLRGAMAVRGLRAALGAVRPRGTGCAAGLRSASKPSEPGPEPAGPVTAALYVHVSVGTRGWARTGLLCVGSGARPRRGSRLWQLQAGAAGARGVPLPRAHWGAEGSVCAESSSQGCGWWALGVDAVCGAVTLQWDSRVPHRHLVPAVALLPQALLLL